MPAPPSGCTDIKTESTGWWQLTIFATMLCCVDWWNAWVWVSHSKECSLPHLIVPDISHPQWTYSDIVGFWFFSLCCLALAHGQNMAVSLWAFAQNIICGVLIGWGCSGDWQPRHLYHQDHFQLAIIAEIRWPLHKVSQSGGLLTCKLRHAPREGKVRVTVSSDSTKFKLS